MQFYSHNTFSKVGLDKDHSVITIPTLRIFICFRSKIFNDQTRNENATHPVNYNIVGLRGPLGGPCTPRLKT